MSVVFGNYARKMDDALPRRSPVRWPDEWSDDEDPGYKVVYASMKELERRNGGSVPRGRRRPGPPPLKRDDDGARRRLLEKAPTKFRRCVQRHGDETLGSFNLRVYYDPLRTGFEDSKDLRVAKGAVLAGRYEIRSVVGKAAFSTTYAALDNTKKVCLKVITNNKDFFDQSIDEIKLLRYLNESCDDVDDCRVVRLIDYFYAREHLVIVTELLGENLYEHARRRRAAAKEEPYFSPGAIREIARDCAIALEYVHSLGLVHCDVKPENVVLRPLSTAGNFVVKLIDFGSSCFVSDPPATYVQSRSYRAPEVVLGATYSSTIDVWSLGCVLAEVHTGDVLFHNDSVATLLARIVAVLGPVPPRLLAEARFKDDFFLRRTGDIYDRIANIVQEEQQQQDHHLGLDDDDDDIPFEDDDDDDQDDDETTTAPAPEDDDLDSLDDDTQEDDDGSRHHQRTEEQPFVLVVPKPTTLAHRLHLPRETPFVDFLRRLLTIDPLHRPSAKAALRHPYLEPQ